MNDGLCPACVDEYKYRVFLVSDTKRCDEMSRFLFGRRLTWHYGSMICLDMAMFMSGEAREALVEGGGSKGVDLG